MKLEEVMALVRAGYTKDEIAAMSAPEPATAPAAEPESASTADTEPAPTSSPEPMPTPAPQVSQTEVLLREILGAVRMGNITKAMTEPPVEKGADVVTARIINPGFGKEK